MATCAHWGAAGEFAASRHGVLTRSQAAECGISSKVIQRLKRDGELEEPLPGVPVIRGSVPTWRQRLYIATLSSNASGRAAFRSAAALNVLDGYPPGPVELLFPSPRRTTLQEVVHHYGPMGPEHAADFIEVDGIPCTGIARTLCDLGSVDDPQRVRIAFESAWRAVCSLVWMRQIAERLHRPGQRGTGVMLGLLDQAQSLRVPTEAVLELQVESALRDIPGLVRQYNVRDRNGQFVARVDFAIPELKIAIEAHSRRFHFGQENEDNDSRREASLHGQGWIVRFVTSRSARDQAALRSSVMALVRARSS